MKRKNTSIVLRILALLLCVALLGSCRAAEAIPRVGDGVRELTLVMKSDMPEIAKTSAQYFAFKTAELSKNKIRISLVESGDPLNETTAFDFLFVPNAEMEKISSVFAPISSPYYFYDYAHLTISLNSAQFWQQNGNIVKSVMEVEPLGAFYSGSSYFVTSSGKLLDTMDQFQEAKLYIAEDQVLAFVLKKLGAEVMTKTPDEIAVGFNSGRYRNVEFSSIALEKLAIPEKNGGVNLCYSFHKAFVNWLFASSDTMERLTNRERAILAEAAAFAVAQNDKLMLQAEENGVAYLMELGVTQSKPNYSEFQKRSTEILKVAEKYNSLWDWEVFEAIRETADKSE